MAGTVLGSNYGVNGQNWSTFIAGQKNNQSEFVAKIAKAIEDESGDGLKYDVKSVTKRTEAPYGFSAAYDIKISNGMGIRLNDHARENIESILKGYENGLHTFQVQVDDNNTEIKITMKVY